MVINSNIFALVSDRNARDSLLYENSSEDTGCKRSIFFIPKEIEM